MIPISGFGLENVHCFASKQRMDVRPITFLVGNNSTGKTTALGCLRNMIDCLALNRIDFNQEPYKMGGFADILRNSSRKRSFSLETSYLAANEEEMTVAAEFADTGGLPALRQIRYSFGSGVITCKLASSGALKDQFYKLSETARNKFSITVNKAMADHLTWLLEYVFRRVQNQGEKAGSAAEKNLAAFMTSLSRAFTYKVKANGKTSKFGFNPFYHFYHPIDFGPVRSKPERVYTPVSSKSPEGGDVPMKLMRLHHENKTSFNKISRQIGAFGKAAGLFDGIEVKGTMGKSLADPFQLLVATEGNKSNLADVGYGISQILPLLFEILAADLATRKYDPRPYIVLLQQPEMHLHPRAQAEFASLLARIAGKNPGMFRFIVETHSDFILDRASIEIRKKTIAAKDVSLAFFNTDKGAAKIVNIGYDDAGNLTNVPAGYRDFFNKETNHFLGLD